MFTDIAKNTYQNITEEKLRLVQFLLRREQSFQENGQQLSASIEVRLPRTLPTPLIFHARFQSMHGILGDLQTFSGVFGSALGNMSDVSRGIMEYVR
jgi:hypothetical protein